jgi:hypothetical protein
MNSKLFLVALLSAIRPNLFKLNMSFLKLFYPIIRFFIYRFDYHCSCIAFMKSDYYKQHKTLMKSWIQITYTYVCEVYKGKIFVGKFLCWFWIYFCYISYIWVGLKAFTFTFAGMWWVVNNMFKLYVLNTLCKWFPISSIYIMNINILI